MYWMIAIIFTRKKYPLDDCINNSLQRRLIFLIWIAILFWNDRNIRRKIRKNMKKKKLIIEITIGFWNGEHSMHL